MKNEEVVRKFEELENHINNYRLALNQEGVWLFLATLGCWSVAVAEFQLLAYAITAILFGHRIFLRLTDRRPFAKIVKDLELSIRSNMPNDDSQKARLYDLQQIQNTKLSTWSHIKATPVFMICYVFLFISISNNVARL